MRQQWWWLTALWSGDDVSSSSGDEVSSSSSVSGAGWRLFAGAFPLALGSGRTWCTVLRCRFFRSILHTGQKFVSTEKTEGKKGTLLRQFQWIWPRSFNIEHSYNIASVSVDITTFFQLWAIFSFTFTPEGHNTHLFKSFKNSRSTSPKQAQKQAHSITRNSLILTTIAKRSLIGTFKPLTQ